MEVAIRGMTVAIGMPVFGGIPAGTAMSLFRTINKCKDVGVVLDYINVSAPYVHISRDMVVDAFLKGPCQKLFFIDQDETWEPDAFLRLVAISTERKVVGASYPAKQDGPLQFFINWLDEAKSEPPFGLIKVGGMGLGFTIIDRSVIEQLAAKAPRKRHPSKGEVRAGIFRVDSIALTDDGILDDRGEDIAFFHDVAALGIDVWIDPSITIGHIGQKEWRGRLLDRLQTKPEKLSERFVLND